MLPRENVAGHLSLPTQAVRLVWAATMTAALKKHLEVDDANT
jgi:hypothetical protein